MSPTTLPAPQRTVLLVEDDEATRDALTALLAHEGYLVLPAASGREALRVLGAPLAPVDVALLDIRLPDISGIAVHVAARVGALAGAGEVVVSGTVVDLVEGSGITFDDRGLVSLKGVREPRQLWTVVDG